MVAAIRRDWSSDQAWSGEACLISGPFKKPSTPQGSDGLNHVVSVGDQAHVILAASRLGSLPDHIKD